MKKYLYTLIFLGVLIELLEIISVLKINFL